MYLYCFSYISNSHNGGQRGSAWHGKDGRSSLWMFCLWQASRGPNEGPIFPHKESIGVTEKSEYSTGQHTDKFLLFH